MLIRSGKMGRMRVKEASPAKVSRPGAKKRPPRDRGVISLKGSADPPSHAPASVSDLKTMRLERIKERAGAKRPAGPRSPLAAPIARPERKRKPTSEETPSTASTAVMQAPAVVMEAPPVIEAPTVTEAPAVATQEVAVEMAPVTAEAPGAPVEAAPAVTALAAPVDRDLSATAHRRAWSPPKAPRRTSTPVTLAVRLISKLLRWGGVLRR
jgi:hypothetical protein